MGNHVTLVETSSDVLKKAETVIEFNLKRLSKKLFKDKPDTAATFISDTKSKIKGTTDLIEAVKTSDLVVEAIIENLEVKQQLFKTIDAVAPPKTLFASNTSSLLISDIASLTQRKDKFGGLHFFVPVPLVNFLEIIRTSETSEETYQELLTWGKSLGKTCLTCKDTPGFIVNRLLIPYVNEAIKMVERGKVTIYFYFK